MQSTMNLGRTLNLCAAMLCVMGLSACPNDEDQATPDAGSSNGDAGSSAGKGGATPHGGTGGHVAGSGGKAEAGTGKAGTGGKAAAGSGGAGEPDDDAGVSAGKLCGTRGAGQCEAAEFCNFEPDKDCGATDRGGMCEAKPNGCPKNLAWVCGCDGQSYSNECVAHAAGVSVKQDGMCGAAAGKTCGGIANLQCGAKEYCNYDMGQGCDGSVADAAGTCEAKPDACTDQYEPVCGCDRKTYGNACDAHSQSASILHAGACTVSDCEKLGGRVAVGIGPAPMCEKDEVEYTHIINDDGSMAIEGMLCCTKK